MKKFTGYAKMLSLIAAIVIVAATTPASAEEITLTTVMPPTLTPTGSIVMWAGSGATADIPVGWMLCDGSAISRTDYSPLFAIVGEIYGAGDGATTFNIPNLTARFPAGASNTHLDYALGRRLGAASVTLTTGQMPVHSHGCGTAGNHYHRMLVWGSYTANKVLDWGTDYNFSAEWKDGDWAGNHNHPINNAGSGTAHENRPQYIALFFIIKK